MSGDNGNGRLPRHELRRIVSEEALARIDELEERCKTLVAKNNQLARAMEAIANAITAYALESEGLKHRIEALERPYWRRVVLAIGLQLKMLQQMADEYGRMLARRADAGGKVTMRRIPDDDGEAVPPDPEPKPIGARVDRVECVCDEYEQGRKLLPPEGATPCPVHPQRTFYPGPCGVTN